MSLTTAISGLKAGQLGLQVTGHNISNVNTKGYTRQQLMQADSMYRTVGTNGGNLQQVGIGVSAVEIRQIRDEFADKRYREANSELGYYTVVQEATSEIEAILDEPYGESLSRYLKDLYEQIQKLSLNPSGVEERNSFLQTSQLLIDKANDITDNLQDYQMNLNAQVVESSNKINAILKQIKEYNTEISAKEGNGDNANDLRDQRNVLLDELSSYLPIDYKEDASGAVVVKSEGHYLVDTSFLAQIDFKQSASGSPFVTPIWRDTQEEVCKLNQVITSTKENAEGSLKALLVARGDRIASVETSWDEIAFNDNFSVDEEGNSYIIPKYQKQLALFVEKITSVINEELDGYGMGTNESEFGVPVFVPIKMPDGVATLKPEELGNSPTAAQIQTYNEKMAKYAEAIKPYLTAGNIQVNPELLAEGGYNKLGTCETKGLIGDSSKLIDLLNTWGANRQWPEDSSSITSPLNKNVNFQDFYAELVADLGADGYLYKAKVEEQQEIVTSAENDRLSVGAVAQDEELTYMMKYQYAYSASARMINILDGMLETVINM